MRQRTQTDIALTTSIGADGLERTLNLPVKRRHRQRSQVIMIAGLMKRRIDPLWEHAASPLIGIGMTPNQVTSGGLVLVALSCAAYLY
ncbi:MAG: hypothetical protein E5Y18_05175, partial [Mesorhizobium sp.]